MKRERNLQEADVEEADDLHSHGRKKVKTDQMDGAEDQRERSGDDKSIIQEPDDLSDNTRILHPPHGHQNEDYPVSDENPPSIEDLNGFHKEDDRAEENPEMDGSGDQESIQEHGAINEGKEDLNENRIISYVRLPQDYPVSIPSERSELGSSVLNDLYVLSVKPPISLKDSNLHKYKEPTQELAGNEGHDDDEESSERSSPSKNKLNKYQKALFDVEDKQFEADMLVESVSSACKRFEEVNKIDVKKGEASVLNDRMELNPEGVQDHSKSKREFNEYEKALFKVEHELLEMEMFIESLELASACLKEVYQKILENKIDVKKEDGFNIEEYFRISSLTLIEREHGVDDPEELRNNPTIALPKLLERIEEKRKELEHRRQELNKVWGQCYAKNHAKSLQFRSS